VRKAIEHEDDKEAAGFFLLLLIVEPIVEPIGDRSRNHLKPIRFRDRSEKYPISEPHLGAKREFWQETYWGQVAAV
jgi:hypothetical protein